MNLRSVVNKYGKLFNVVSNISGNKMSCLSSQKGKRKKKMKIRRFSIIKSNYIFYKKTLLYDIVYDLISNENY